MDLQGRLRGVSIKARVLAWVSLLVVAGVWGLASVVAALAHANLEKLLVRQLADALEYVAHDAEHGLQVRIEALKRLGAAVTPEIQADPRRLRQLLKQSDLAADLFPEGVIAVDGRGIVQAECPVVAGRLGSSLADRANFRQIMAGGALVVSAPVAGSSAGRVAAELAVPLRAAAGAAAGSLIATVRLSDPDLFGQIETAKLGKTGYFLVISPRDRLILSHTDKSRILTSAPAAGENPLLDRRLGEGYEGAGIIVGPLGVETLSVSRKLQTTDWIAIGGMSTEEAFAPIATLKRDVYLGALAISVLISLVLGLVLRRELVPLADSAAAISRMSTGEMPLAPLPVMRNDEIGQLVLAFNRFVAEHYRLNESLRAEIAERRRGEAEVRELNESLERRVTDRTDALLELNRKLEEQVTERQNATMAATDLASRLQVMTRRHASAHESERRRLARELHDRVSSSLTAIGLSLGLLKGQLPPETGNALRQRLAETEALLRETIMTSREISHDLHPAVLDYGGVIAALEDHGRRFSSQTDIAVEVTGRDRDIRFSPATEIALYRIAQEALTNCAKHAGAKRVRISLDGEGEHGVLTVSDDGGGFDPGALTSGGAAPGLGLLSMRERAEAIGGRLMLQSAPGSGTRIIVEF